MLILDEDDKNNIGSMIPENKLYVKFSYSDNLCDEEENQKIVDWIAEYKNSSAG